MGTCESASWHEKKRRSAPLDRTTAVKRGCCFVLPLPDHLEPGSGIGRTLLWLSSPWCDISALGLLALVLPRAAVPLPASFAPPTSPALPRQWSEYTRPCVCVVIQFIRTLGRGSYGEVAQCKDLKDGGLVAIKRVLNVFNSEVRSLALFACVGACVRVCVCVFFFVAWCIHSWGSRHRR